MSSVGELISTSRALSSRCSWALSFLDGEQNETGHKPQSGGKLCDFFGKLVLFVCILALLAGCCLGFLEEAFENEVNFKSISFGEHYLLQGYGQELFVAFMGLLNFINVAWWSIACTSTSALGFGDSLHHKLCGGADGALHRQFRGGAGGSSASSGSQSMPQDEVSRFVAQVATLVSKWQVVTPTRNELKQELQTIMEEVGKSPWSQHIAGARQSFYEQFGGRALQSQVGKEEPKEAKAPTKGKGKSKGATRGKGPPDLPHFDLKRIAPSRAIISWQAVAASLILVARIGKEEEGKQFLDGGKTELLPFVQARMATLDKGIPDLSGPILLRPMHLKSIQTSVIGPPFGLLFLWWFWTRRTRTGYFIALNSLYASWVVNLRKFALLVGRANMGVSREMPAFLVTRLRSFWL